MGEIDNITPLMTDHTDLIARLRRIAKFWRDQSAFPGEVSVMSQAADALEAATRRDLGVSAAPTGPAGQGPEPVPVSAVPALVPDADDPMRLAMIEMANLPDELVATVRHHIREMYPKAVSAAPGTFLLSVGNHLRNKMDGPLDRLFAAYAQGTSAFGRDPQGHEAKPAGPVHEVDAPNPDHSLAEQGEKK